MSLNKDKKLLEEAYNQVIRNSQRRFLKESNGGTAYIVIDLKVVGHEHAHEDVPVSVEADLGYGEDDYGNGYVTVEELKSITLEGDFDIYDENGDEVVQTLKDGTVLYDKYHGGSEKKPIACPEDDMEEGCEFTFNMEQVEDELEKYDWSDGGTPSIRYRMVKSEGRGDDSSDKKIDPSILRHSHVRDEEDDIDPDYYLNKHGLEGTWLRDPQE